MTTATLSSKGQITIPSAIRQALQVDTGDRIEFVEIAPGRYEFFAANRSVTELKGMFGVSPKVVSIEQMNAAIAKRGASAQRLDSIPMSSCATSCRTMQSNPPGRPV
jgi:antitoxin PrlF